MSLEKTLKFPDNKIEKIYFQCLEIINEEKLEECNYNLSEEEEKKDKLKIIYLGIKLILELLEGKKEEKLTSASYVEFYIKTIINKVKGRRDGEKKAISYYRKNNELPSEDIQKNKEGEYDYGESVIIDFQKSIMDAIKRLQPDIDSIIKGAGPENQINRKKCEEDLLCFIDTYKNYDCRKTKRKTGVLQEDVKDIQKDVRDIQKDIKDLHCFLKNTPEVFKGEDNIEDLRERVKQGREILQKMNSKISDNEKMKIKFLAKEESLILEIGKIFKKEGMSEEFIKNFLFFLAEKEGWVAAKKELANVKSEDDPNDHEDYELLIAEIRFILKAFEYACSTKKKTKILAKYREEYSLLKKKTKFETYARHSKKENFFTPILKYINQKILFLFTQ